MTDFHPEYSRWDLPAVDAERAHALSQSLEVEPAFARVLVHRGFDADDECRHFLDPAISRLHEPDSLPDIDAAVSAIEACLENGARIVVYGDYDVDGTTGAALLTRFLRLAGAQVLPYIPNRLTDGYGLGEAGVRWILDQRGALVITVDNGIGAHAEIARLGGAGVPVIVTDHHEPGAELPPALAVLNPKRRDSAYPFRDLCGAGVAYKLAWALAVRRSRARKVKPEFRRFLVDALTLVAIATIADVVPLLGENRILVGAGLRIAARCPFPGVAALCEVAEVDAEACSTRHVGYRLAPRLNAGGRLGEADLGLRLLTTESWSEARDLAARLDALNKERRTWEQAITDQALAQVPAPPTDCALVLSGSWHSGVMGIVAGRIADRFARPTLVISTDQTPHRGSGRSVPGFPLHEALAACGEHLESHGGHAMAGGFSLAPDRLEAFAEAFRAYARAHWSLDRCVSVLPLDAELRLEEITHRLHAQLASLAPFGEGNLAPTLCARGLRLAGKPSLMGQGQRHLSFHVSDGERGLRCVAFGKSAWMQPLIERDRRIDVAFRLSLNTWRDKNELELELVDLRFASGQ